ncbi:molybdopterin molybdotransferase MoeA [Paucidesulfovibrio longus]|uniref:molybdopterin molybdotransferase MoeA n=1 Tax=Paucidesulfovibrio longus TaxID=889 RepID=UPI0003B5C420|nr:molybdopterin molybdotransferase MoeA [Paucidesulfovibrio longus]
MNTPHASTTPDRKERPTRAQAVALLLRSAPRPAPLRLPPWQAVGRVAAADLRAEIGVPECAVSLRDGYALRAEDTGAASAETPLRLATQGRLTADARQPQALARGKAVRILTGAPLPPGADAVIPFENLAEPPGPQDQAILLSEPAQQHAFILPQGGDLPAGSLLARSGTRITSQAGAVLTRARVEELPVHPRPAFAMFGLGSELAAPAPHGDPDRIPADNVVLVANLLRSWGLEAAHCSVLPDDLAAVTAALRETVEFNPRPALIVTTGGTGRSERDYARKAAEQAGFKTLFAGLDVRPGKNAFAALRRDAGKANVLLLGLPGPPAAVFACLHGLALPLARQLCGLPPDAGLRAALRTGLRTRRGSEWLLPCSLNLADGQLAAVPLHGDEWPSLRALAEAHAVAVLPPDSELRPGQCLELLCGDLGLIGL